MDKASYIKGLLCGRICNQTVIHAAVIYYHSGIPYKTAEKYMDVLVEKLRGVRDNKALRDIEID